MTGSGEYYHLPKSEDETDKEIASLFNSGLPSEQLWDDPSTTPLTTEMLGSFALGQNPNRKVANWTERYIADRARFNAGLTSIVEQVAANSNVADLYTAEIISSQYALPEPPVDGDDLTDIARRLSRGRSMVTDSLMVIGGFLDRIDLAIILKDSPTSSLPENMRNSIKKSARRVGNRLPFDPDQLRDTETPEAVTSFHESVATALETNRVVSYSADIWGPKIFLKQQSGQLAMVRRTDVANFAAWLKAYESSDVWSSLGFTHIPVEPILSFELDSSHGSVDSRTELLQSVNFATAFETADPQTQKKLAQQARAIVIGLDQIGVNHGHLHVDNLMVSGHETDPRVYAIDFDKALIRKRT